MRVKYPVRNLYIRKVLIQRQIYFPGFKDVAEMWQSEYEVSDFEEQLAKLWEDVKPLYQQLHAYVRKRLRDKYGENIVSAKGPIPAHLLGDFC